MILTCRIALRLAAVLFIHTALVGCNDNSAAQQQSGARPKITVRAQTLHSQEIALTKELPGRTAAHLISEVRPRVSGVIQRRIFTEGGTVEAGDVLYELDSAPFQAAVRNAEAALQRAQSAVPSAHARFERYGSLITKNVVSQQELDEAQSQMLQAQADVAAASAALEIARINLEYTKVRAPISGHIDSSNVTEGALVTENQATPLTTIRQLDIINVDLVRSSASLLSLNKALASESMQSNGSGVTVELLLEDGTRYPHPGKLQFRNAAVSSSTGMVSYRATFPNPQGILLPGMYVRALVEDGFVQNGFLLPQRAVSRNARGEAIAKFVNSEMKIEERSFPVMQSVGNAWLVNNGVDDGDRIVVEGAQRTAPGQEVDVTAVTVDDETGEVKMVAQAQAAASDRGTGDQVSVRTHGSSLQ